MATRRYSLNPEDHDHAILDTAGAATVSKNIELTVDWDTLNTQVGAQARLQVAAALKRLAAYIESSGKFALPS